MPSVDSKIYLINFVLPGVLKSIVAIKQSTLNIESSFVETEYQLSATRGSNSFSLAKFTKMCLCEAVSQ